MKLGSGVVGQDLDPLIGLFRSLTDKTRLNILMLLAAGERNVGSLCEELSLPQPTVSHHLGLLRLQNLINNRRTGKQVFYSLNGNVSVSESEGISFDLDGFAIRVIPRTA